MNPREFANAIIDDVDKNVDTFATNMEKLGVQENEYADWLGIFIKWMEWNTKKDRERYYGVKHD